MYADIFHALGGVGLFLLGMLALTDGLRALAGATLRRMLERFTDTPVKGALAGAGATAVIQSSSATTVMAVGFVAAGLMTFPQGLGIILGANIGTTITGWLVALLGFKLSLGTVVSPFVLLGALMKMFGGARVGAAGWALAGFALIFIGIEAIQAGMAQFEGVVTPADFPDDDIPGRLLLVLIGMAVTLVTQSSSAGVATALAALGAGAISFPQAAAMVIGMDVGTTFTAALATVGGSTASRRTGFAHVIYNVMNGSIAFFLLVPYSAWIGGPMAAAGVTGAQFALVGFHTFINCFGVSLALPFAHSYARLIEMLFPERGPRLTWRLEGRLMSSPELAAAAADAATRDVVREMAALLGALLAGRDRTKRLEAVRRALEDIRLYADRTPVTEATAPRLRTVLHMLDHLTRLAHRCEQSHRIHALAREGRLRRLARVLAAGAAQFAGAPPDAAYLDRIRRLMRRQHRARRHLLVDAAPLMAGGSEEMLHRLDALRWLQRVSYHLWRIAAHMTEETALDEESALEAEED